MVRPNAEIFCPENLSERRAYFKGERREDGRGGASGRGAVAAFAARRLSCPFSMGLRPRLSAVAASAAYWNPRAGASGRGAVAAYAARLMTLNFSMGLRPRPSAAAASAALLEPPGWRPGMIPSIVLPLRSYAVLGRSIPHVDARGIIYSRIAAPTAGGGFGEAVGAERGNSFPATRLRLVGLINLRMRCVCWLTTPSRFSPRS